MVEWYNFTLWRRRPVFDSRWGHYVVVLAGCFLLFDDSVRGAGGRRWGTGAFLLLVSTSGRKALELRKDQVLNDYSYRIQM
mgnify:CR=1 FL=1